MNNRITPRRNRFSLCFVTLSAAFLLHAPLAQAGAMGNTAGGTASLTLPADYSWADPQSGSDPAGAAKALQSLGEAQAYSPLYNPAWLYDLEIFHDTNLSAPSGGYIGTGQSAGTGMTDPGSQTVPAGLDTASATPLDALAFAAANSPSYDSSWQSDMALFLNRDSVGTDPGATDVPEPATLPVLATGIFGLGLVLLKRRSRRPERATASSHL